MLYVFMYYPYSLRFAWVSALLSPTIKKCKNAHVLHQFVPLTKAGYVVHFVKCDKNKDSSSSYQVSVLHMKQQK